MEDRILEAAYNVFISAGYRGATTRRIAAEAGVNEVTLFRHFSSKEELIVAALQHHSERMIAILAAYGLPERPQDVAVELGAYMEMILLAMAETHQAHRTSIGEWGQHPAIDEYVLRTTTYVFDEVNRYVSAAQRDGLVRRDISSQVIVQALLGVLFSDALMRSTLPGYYGDDPATSARDYRAILLEGLLTPTA